MLTCSMRKDHQETIFNLSTRVVQGKKKMFVAPCFEKLRRFTADNPVGFDPESIENVRTFHKSGESVDRVVDAS